MNQIGYNSKSVRLGARLLEDIRRGQFGPGSVLPIQNELADRYRVSRATIRRTLTMLTEQQKLERLPGGGVAVPAEADGPAKESGRPVRTSGKVAIAAVWAAELDWHIMGLREGIRAYAKEAGLEFKMFLSPEGHSRALEVLERIESHPTQGVIVFPYGSPGYVSAVERLVARRYPVVCVDRVVGEVRTSSVEVDNAEGMYQATSHLIERYQRPVYFVTLRMDHKTIQDRYAGYRWAMTDAGFESEIASHTYISEASETDPSNWSVERKQQDVTATVDKLFAEAKGPLSVACMNDPIARWVYEGASSRGLVVGKDVMVAGFDDIPMAKILQPGLTTVRQPRRQVGYEAAKLLQGLIEGRLEAPVNVHLPVELVVRGSS